MTAKIKIIEMSGKTSYFTETMHKLNNIIIELNFENNLSDGIYFIEISKGNEQVVKKLIVH